MATPLRPPPADTDWLTTEATGVGRARRTPVLARLGRALAGAGRRVNWAAARTPILAAGGFGWLSAAAWGVAWQLGAAAVGVSLLLLELLSGSDRPPVGRR